MTEHDQKYVETFASWLGHRRWYGDKTRQLIGTSIDFRASAGVEGREFALEVVRLSFASGHAVRYILVRDIAEPDADGIESDAFRTWLLRGFDKGRRLEGDGGALRWSATAEEALPWDEFADESRVFRGEQSNSSIVYSDRVIFKLFRKLREGVNPEVEVGEFLTRHTGFRAFPRLVGTVSLERDGDVMTIAAVQEFIPSIGDAWGWLTERIGDPAIRPATVEAAHLLGVRTGEMHIAFASGEADTFVPEVASGAYAERVRAEARGELRDTVDQLSRRGVGGTAVLGDSLDSALDALLETEGTMITRVHGDYHLGQVLRTTDEDFAILDFEGEPTRSLAERRAKASSLRDVAGMLRSFDYAAETARREYGSETREIDEWYDAARKAFLGGYDMTVSGNDTLMRGWEPGAREAVLAALEVHKALYEVRYELSNRPDWLEIPLNALRRIAADTGSTP